MLPNAAAAGGLPFVLGATPATPAQIHAEFGRVDALPQGHSAAFYRTRASLELTQTEIDARLLGVLTGFAAELRSRLPHFDTLPDGVKLALLDMIYNLGPNGLFTGYPHLIRAVEAGNWPLAAASCLRHGPAPARNEWTRQQFLSAISGVVAKSKPKPRTGGRA
jgi:hypothetical protein